MDKKSIKKALNVILIEVEWIKSQLDNKEDK